MYIGGLQMHHIGSWCPGRHSIWPLLFPQPLSRGCHTRLRIWDEQAWLVTCDACSIWLNHYSPFFILLNQDFCGRGFSATQLWDWGASNNNHPALKSNSNQSHPSWCYHTVFFLSYSNNANRVTRWYWDEIIRTKITTILGGCNCLPTSSRREEEGPRGLKLLLQWFR